MNQTAANVLRQKAPAILLIIWVAWRLVPICRPSLTLDVRERVLAAEAVRVRQGHAPTLFHWPGTPWTALLAATSAATGTTSERGIARIGRFWVLVFSVVGLVVFYRLARWRLSRNGALLAVVALAVTPGFASGESGFALVDIPALVLGLVGISLALESVGKTGASARRYSLVAGICLGVGGAVKLPTLGFLLAAWGAVASAPPSRGRVVVGRAFLLLGGVGIGFVVGCPFLLLDLARGSDRVLGDLRYEFAHYRRGHFGLVATAHDTPWTVFRRHFEAASWALGSWMAVVAGVGLVAWVWNLRSRWRERLFEAGWLVATVGVLAVERLTFPRHWLIALPPLIVVTLAGIESWKGWARLLGRGAFGAALLAAATMTLGLESVARSPSTLAAYERWFEGERARRPHLAVSVGPAMPALRWIYPDSVIRNALLASVGQVEFFVVAQLEAGLQRAIASQPDAYRESDFFPLERKDFATGAFFDELESSGQYIRFERFERAFPLWARWAALPFPNLPLPLNALSHPTLSVFARADIATPSSPSKAISRREPVGEVHRLCRSSSALRGGLTSGSTWYASATRFIPLKRSTTATSSPRAASSNPSRFSAAVCE